MTEQEIIARFHNQRTPALETLNGRVLSVDPETGRTVMRFGTTTSMCHSVDGHPRGGIVQGGFIAGFLDMAMANACIARSRFTVVVPSLELKVSFLDQVNPGSVLAEGRIRRWGRSIAFLEADLLDEEERLLATASSTAKLVHLHKAGS